MGHNREIYKSFIICPQKAYLLADNNQNHCIWVVQTYPKGQAILIFPLMLFNVYTMQ